MEIIGMFHDLMALFKECVPLSTTSIAVFNVSYVHMPLLVFGAFDSTMVLIFFFVG
jgi:hypothetical protein